MNKPQSASRLAAAFALAAFCAVGTIGTLGVASAAHAADLARGRQLVESHGCAACHGARLDDPISADYPRLAGQHADYLVWAMRQYRMGLANPLLGRDNAIMRAQVQGLSGDDMNDIAAYLESLPGSLVLKK